MALRSIDLMIGDWVYNKNIDKPMQVYPMMFSQMFRQRPDATTEDYNIFPIPLTPEILEKNGWMRVEADGVFYPKQLKGELPWIGYSTNGYSWIFRIRDFCEIKYIHQLQHALRLCRIDKTIEL